MIKITFSEPTDPEWQEWCLECEVARKKLVKLVAGGEKPGITALYKDHRMVGFYKSKNAPFYGKCVYCECNILVNHPGDIEHWRPKNRVTDEKGKSIQIVAADGTNAPHLGYYWLAYEWRNLLFACEDCNRPSTAKTAGKRIGKWDQFPVRGFRAEREEDEDREEPLLINQVEEDPEDHLEIDETGVVIPKTDRGQACIDIFGLNAREALVNARRERIKNTNNELRLAAMAIVAREEQQCGEFVSSFKKIKMGAAEYSAAGRVALHQGKASLEMLTSNL